MRCKQKVQSGKNFLDKMHKSTKKGSKKGCKKMENGSRVCDNTKCI